jgi:hypothetical protein
VMLSITVLVVPLRLRDLLHAMGSECRKCRIAVPYDGLAAALEARHFHSGTIIAEDRHDAGNLRRLFPDARIVLVGRPSYSPPFRAADLSSKSVVIWRKADAKALPEGAEQELARIGSRVTATPERLRWQPYPSTSAERFWEWTAVVVDSPVSPKG